MTALVKVSASHLKLFLLCPRSYYLKHVLRAPDDQGAGGMYLTRGNDFDRLVQLHVRDGVTGDSGAPKLANRQLAEARRHLPTHGQAEVQRAYSIEYTDPATGLVLLVNGKPDLRRPGYIQDTKTTSDRGPGVGAAADRPAYALTDATLAQDEQALLYAWCEFQLDPALESVRCEWIYVSKADCPKCWVARCTLDRAAVWAWFHLVVRPAAGRMAALHALAPASADQVAADPDACRRCFVRQSCPGPFDGVNIYGITSAQPEKRKLPMAFDLNKLRSPTTPAFVSENLTKQADDLQALLQASITKQLETVCAAPVAINRPPSERPACSVRVDPDLTETVTVLPRGQDTAPAAFVTEDDAGDTLVVHSIEGSAAALALLGYDPPGKDLTANAPSDVSPKAPTASAPVSGAGAPAEPPAGSTGGEATPPKARRGRPRKTQPTPTTLDTEGSPGAATAESSATTPTVADVRSDAGFLAQGDPSPTQTTIAPECVVNAGDLCAAVSALLQARAAVSAALLSLGCLS